LTVRKRIRPATEGLGGTSAVKWARIVFGSGYTNHDLLASFPLRVDEAGKPVFLMPAYSATGAAPSSSVSSSSIASAIMYSN
jgi:hypothetical protein